MIRLARSTRRLSRDARLNTAVALTHPRALDLYALTAAVAATAATLMLLGWVMSS